MPSADSNSFADFSAFIDRLRTACVTGDDVSLFVNKECLPAIAADERTSSHLLPSRISDFEGQRWCLTSVTVVQRACAVSLKVVNSPS